MEIPIPYGQERVSIRVPDGNVLGVIHPKRVNTGPERETLLEALEHPAESPAFSDFLDDARDVLFIVNDGTRPTPTATVMKILREHIQGADYQFMVATGAHRAPTDEEFRFIFGPLYDEFRNRIHVHDSRNSSQMVPLGTSRSGTEMFVNRLGLEAHKLVVIGSVEPHYIAGYTGGRKFFLPGVASYRTIEQNHRHGVRPDAKALTLAGNPVHEDMVDAMRAIQDKQVFSIQLVLDRARRIYSTTAGDIHASFDAAIERANEVFCADVPEKADIVVSVATYPMDVDLYQSQKALDNGKLALNEGGILILVGKCRTGVGGRTFFELLAGSRTPQEALERIGRGYELGYHKAAKMAEIALWAEMWAVTDLRDADVESVFMRPFSNIQSALDRALEVKGRGAKILFLTDGSITVPIVR